MYSTYHVDHSMIMACRTISSHAPPALSITDRFRDAEAGGFLVDLIKRRKIGLIIDRFPIQTSGAAKDLIEDNRRRLNVIQFPVG